MTVRLETLASGPDIAGTLDRLADLRIEVFREWPYLYDGTLEYETWYLSRFAAAAGAVLIAALDGNELVGASTGLPLGAEHADLAAPLVAAGYDVDRLYYGAETILRRPYRGRGLYRRFFERREAHALGLGFGNLVFCGVVRPDDHPSRPPDAVALEPVWRRFGYRPMDGVVAEFPWKDLGQDQETAKRMQFWIRPLARP